MPWGYCCSMFYYSGVQFTILFPPDVPGTCGTCWCGRRSAALIRPPSAIRPCYPKNNGKLRRIATDAPACLVDVKISTHKLKAERFDSDWKNQHHYHHHQHHIDKTRDRITDVPARLICGSEDKYSSSKRKNPFILISFLLDAALMTRSKSSMGCHLSSPTATTRFTHDLYQKDPDSLKVEHAVYLADPDVYYWRNLPPNVLQRAERLAHDDQFCHSCMLGESETLEGVCAEDEATLKRLGVTRFQIADVLDTIDVLATKEYLNCCTTTMDDSTVLVILDGRFEVKLSTYGGIQTSPFEDQFPLNRRGGDTNFHVVRTSDRTTFSYGSLLISMIRYFGFFEGRVTGGGYPDVETFRVDPETVIDFFGIQPNVDYSLTHQNFPVWSSSMSLHPDPKQAAVYEKLTKILALAQFPLPNQVGCAYLTWLPALFCTNGCIERKPDLKKLASLATVEEQMNYLIQCKVAPLNIDMGYPDCTKNNVLKAVLDYESQTTLHYPSLLCLEVIGNPQSKADSSSTSREMIELADVFGAEIATWGTGYQLMSLTEEDRVIRWNDLIGNRTK